MKDQRAVMEQHVTEHGVPGCHHTHQGCQLKADPIKELCSRLGATRIRTRYHPEGNGLFERFNRKLTFILCLKLI